MMILVRSKQGRLERQAQKKKKEEESVWGLGFGSGGRDGGGDGATSERACERE